jgi:hypothetical protein
MSKAQEEKMMMERLKDISQERRRKSVMTDQQLIDHLEWAKEDIDRGDLSGAVDHINQVIDSTQHRLEGKKEPDFTWPDARDQHLIRQNLKKVAGLR